MRINIADNLKRLRTQRGITQENLAAFIGVSFQAVSKWERGEGLQSFPNDYEVLANLACYLDGYGATEEERNTNLCEAIKISERILEFCTDSTIRNNVQANLCFFLCVRARKRQPSKKLNVCRNVLNGLQNDKDGIYAAYMKDERMKHITAQLEVTAN